MTPAEIAGLLEPTAEVLRLQLRGFPAELSGWHPKDGEWCVNEVLAHLVATERIGCRGRAQLLAQAAFGEEPELPPSPDPEKACGRALEEMIAEFQRERAESVAWLRSLGAVDLSRSGRHPRVGPLSLSDVLHEWPYHDAAHLRQVLANVEAWLWPQLGNAQKFDFS